MPKILHCENCFEPPRIYSQSSWAWPEVQFRLRLSLHHCAKAPGTYVEVLHTLWPLMAARYLPLRYPFSWSGCSFLVSRFCCFNSVPGILTKSRALCLQASRISHTEPSLSDQLGSRHLPFTLPWTSRGSHSSQEPHRLWPPPRCGKSPSCSSQNQAPPSFLQNNESNCLLQLVCSALLQNLRAKRVQNLAPG